MSKPFTMPALSPTMEKATLARWRVAIGDRVKVGDVLAEIETDKATMEIEAEEGGVVADLLVAAGSEDVPVGAAIGRIDAESRASAPLTAGAASAAPALATAPPEPMAGEVAAPTQPNIEPDPSPPALVRPDHRSNVSPLASRIAMARGLDLDGVTGSGQGGRVMLTDVGAPKFKSSPPPAAMTAPRVEAVANEVEAKAPPPSVIPHQVVRLSQMRRTIARRLSQSKQTIPHFYLTMHLRVGALLAQREELNGKLAGRGVKLSVNDLLIKALALALLETPDANVQFAGDAIWRFERADVAMAVAIPDGLVTPVLRDAGRKPLSAISLEARTLALRAREGKLSPQDYEGGTASISNLGMFGVDEIIPVINPPHGLILGVGAISERATTTDGRLEAQPIITATASFDHRAIDGAAGAQFMAAFKRLVEAPFALLVA